MKMKPAHWLALGFVLLVLSHRKRASATVGEIGQVVPLQLITNQWWGLP